MKNPKLSYATKPIKNFFCIGSTITNEQNNWPLWIPVIFALGIITYFSFGSKSLFLTISLLIFAVFTALRLRNELKSLIAISIALFLSGFLWSKFYDFKFIKAPIIDSQTYGTVIGKVDFIKEYETGAKKLTISDLNIYQIKFNTKTTNKPKKKRKNTNYLSPKPIKITQNIQKTYLNLEGYPEIDRELTQKIYSDNFKNGKYQNPPKKIDLIVRGKNLAQNLEIGDVIRVKVLLQPFEKEDKINNFNFNQYYYFKQIGGSGFSIGDITIIGKNLSYEYQDKINHFRYKIAQNIQDNFADNKEEAAIFIVLLLGIRDFISNDLMGNIRKSGLADLLSISGLHLSLAAAIFFVFFRFLLTRSQYLALRFNIKKIATILAIISSFGYLILAGAPVSAVRAFFMILVVFLAILFNQNSNPFRSLAFAALVVLIIDPSSIYSISFQMSFMAVLVLITFYDFSRKYKETDEPIGVLRKFFYYFLGIVVTSFVAQATLAPLIIYYFNNFALLGILSSLAAVPLVTFIIMPLGFLYLFLLIFNLETLILYPLNFALKNIVAIANFVANLEFSSVKISLVSQNSLMIIISGFLWLCLWKEKWRYFGVILIIIGAFLAHKTPLPNLIIDGKRQYFAIFDEKKEELFFSRNVRKSARINSLMQKLAQKEFKTIEEMKDKEIYCEYEYCKVKIKEKQIFILTQRNKIDDICWEKYDILINLSKFKLPECVDFSKIIINNTDLARFGSQYLYL